jgi:cytochrome c-type protein NapB
MKLTKVALGLATVAALFFAGCTSTTYSEEEIGLRKTNLYTEGKETTGDKTMYAQTAAGESELIERAFENAPPMIPHDVTGMLPITTDNNSCVGCHDPASISYSKAVPYPKSHMMDFRSQMNLGRLSEQRFNCSQCHAPQSTGELVKNEFEADFRDGGEESSNLIKNLNEGVK